MLNNQVEKIEKQWNKKEVRKNTSKLARAILVYEFIMLFIVIADMIRRCIPIDNESHLDSVFVEAMNSGTSSIIAVFLGLLFLLFYFRKYNYQNLIFHSKEKMTGISFLVLLTIFMSTQAVFSLSGAGIEACLNYFGYSILGDIESASSISSTVSMLIYASFVGPIAEEIIFRGFIMRGFQKFGSFYAILMSSMIFGAFHGNLIQSVFAAAVGLVLGYIAMQYSIKWAILLHIINNFIFGDLLSFLISNLNESSQLIILYVIQGTFFVGTVAIILLKRKEWKQFIKGIQVEKGLLRLTFTSIWLLIFLTIQLIIGISGIEKLPM